MEKDLQNLSINTMRFLSADAVQKANSGHPGLPMGCAAIAYTIWTRHLRHNPRNPGWAGPRPLHPLRRAWLDAAVFPAAPDRLRSAAR